MADPSFNPATNPSPYLPAETVPLSVCDRTAYIDRCYRLLADRRRRFCLYHLVRVNTPISIRQLAGEVEVALAPAGEEVTERIIDDAVGQFICTHLPKLRAVGLLQVDDDNIKLVPDSPLRIREWLSITAAVELDSGRGEDWIASAR